MRRLTLLLPMDSAQNHPVEKRRKLSSTAEDDYSGVGMHSVFLIADLVVLISMKLPYRDAIRLLSACRCLHKCLPEYMKMQYGVLNYTAFLAGMTYVGRYTIPDRFERACADNFLQVVIFYLHDEFNTIICNSYITAYMYTCGGSRGQGICRHCGLISCGCSGRYCGDAKYAHRAPLLSGYVAAARCNRLDTMKLLSARLDPIHDADHYKCVLDAFQSACQYQDPDAFAPKSPLSIDTLRFLLTDELSPAYYTVRDILTATPTHYTIDATGKQLSDRERLLEDAGTCGNNVIYALCLHERLSAVKALHGIGFFRSQRTAACLLVHSSRCPAILEYILSESSINSLLSTNDRKVALAKALDYGDPNSLKMLLTNKLFDVKVMLTAACYGSMIYAGSITNMWILLQDGRVDPTELGTVESILDSRISYTSNRIVMQGIKIFSHDPRVRSYMEAHGLN
jgi:hypothetical protein